MIHQSKPNQVGRKDRVAMIICVALLLSAQSALALPTQALREAAEFVIERFAKEVAEETAETMTAKLAVLCADHGDEAVQAVRAVGPRALRVIAEAGEHSDDVIRLMVKHGDDAAWVIGQPQRLALFAKHGDEAAEAMIKHKDIVVPLVERYDDTAVQAFRAVNGQNARRIAMLEDAGELARIGQTDQLLGVVGRFGDRAADFVWRNKAALATAAALTAFLADPEPFINGTRDLATVVGDVAREPMLEVARNTNWTTVILTVFGACVAMTLIRRRRVAA